MTKKPKLYRTVKLSHIENGIAVWKVMDSRVTYRGPQTVKTKWIKES